MFCLFCFVLFCVMLYFTFYDSYVAGYVFLLSKPKLSKSELTLIHTRIHISIHIHTGLKYKEQCFNMAGAGTLSSLLLVSCIGLCVPMLFHSVSFI